MVRRGRMTELKIRGIIRTDNAPAGDYAEQFVHRALSGRLAPNSAAVIVFFSDVGYGVIRAAKVPRALVEANCKHPQHDNSYKFHVTEAILSDPSVIDLTDPMSAAA